MTCERCNQLAAELAEAIKLRDFHDVQAQRIMLAKQKAEAERDRARDELAALKGRKVKLPLAWGATEFAERLVRRSDVIDAILAAGVEVENAG